MNIMPHIRRRLLAGLLIIVPFGITLFVAATLFGFLEGLIQPFLKQVYTLPIWNEFFDENVQPQPIVRMVMTVLLAVIMLYVLGVVSTTYIVAKVYSGGERLVMRIPVMKSVYGLTKQITDLVMTKDAGAFKKLVMIEYPRKGSYALAFMTGQTQFVGDPNRYINLFLPTTPNPTSGYMLILPEEEVWSVNMSIEEGIKMIISGGVITPETIERGPYRMLPDNTMERVGKQTRDADVSPPE